MQESNFAFPAQNKACVCITSQLMIGRICPFLLLACFSMIYDFLHFISLALDTTSPLPLFNSLTHLTYLTTSPHIHKIMTMDSGLERLVQILQKFWICPETPENPAILYSLIPPNSHPPKLSPALNPHSFNKHATYRFYLAFLEWGGHFICHPFLCTCFILWLSVQFKSFWPTLCQSTGIWKSVYYTELCDHYAINLVLEVSNSYDHQHINYYSQSWQDVIYHPGSTYHFKLCLPYHFIHSPKVVKETIMTDINKASGKHETA